MSTTIFVVVAAGEVLIGLRILPQAAEIIPSSSAAVFFLKLCTE